MPRNPAFIDWRRSQSKHLILNDLRRGFLSLDANVTPAALAWEHYRCQPVIIDEGVVYEQFRDRLADHRVAVAARVNRATFDAAAVAHDRANNPFPTHNARGQPNFHLSPAQSLLRDDMRNSRHEGMTPSAFQQTRPEYQVFGKRKFKELMSQTSRHLKFNNFLNERRTEVPFDYQPW